MTPHDMLNGQAAKASTPVRGHYIVRFQDYIRARKYVLPTGNAPGDAVAATSADTILGARSGATTREPSVATEDSVDRLEAAWRGVNSVTGDLGLGRGEAVDAGMMLRWGCGIITTEDVEEEDGGIAVGGESVEAEKGKTPAGTPTVTTTTRTRRVLWVFSTGDESLLMLPQFQKASVELIDPEVMFTCSKHGNSFQCLDSPFKAKDQSGAEGSHVPPRERCQGLRWTLDSQLKELWGLLTDAVVEGLAWRNGRRVIMRPGPRALHDAAEMRGMLHPATATKLILQIHALPRPTLSIPSNPDSETGNVRPVLLSPLGIPALFVSTFMPSEAQESILSDSFSSSLGNVWFTHKAGKQLVADLDRQVYTSWSVVWVPTTKGGVDVVKWTEGPGVLTIWPSTHLADLLPGNLEPLPVAHPAAPVYTPTAPSDLLSAAVEIYGMMSVDENTAGPPEAPPVIAAENVVSPESPMFGSEPGEESKSDIDDLFSAHSGDGDDAKDQDTREPDGDVEIGYELLSEIDDEEDTGVELERDVEMESPPRHVPEMEENVDNGEINLVTEDDFAFFDSPQDRILETVDEQEELMEEPEKVEVKEPEIPPESAPTVKSPATVTAPEPVPTDAGQPLQTLESAQEADISDTGAKETEVVKVVSIPSPPSLTHSMSDHSAESDLIPADFEPLRLDRSPNTFYLPPSPALTPESLRPELLERLSAQKGKKAEYTAAWEMSSESSSSGDEDEPVSGAPPTPMSMLEENVEIEVQGKISIGLDSETELKWNGKKCQTTDWFWMSNENSTELATSWDAAWDAAMSPPKAGPSVDRRLGTIDCTRLARHIMFNRHLRAYILHHERKRHDLAIEEEQMDVALSWMDRGSPLYEILGPQDAEPGPSNPRTFPTPQIHVGYAGHAMRISTAGLRYWRQLGIHPLGGKKNLAINVLYDQSGEGSHVAASEFVNALTRIYESLNLGKLTQGSVFGTQCMAMDVNDMKRHLVAAFDHDLSDTVLIVLVDSAASLDVPFSPDLNPGNHNFIFQILPSTPADLVPVAFEIYDRISRPVHPISVRGMLMESSASTQISHFAMVDEARRKPDLTLAWPLRSYDVMNRWTTIHCAFTYDVELDLLVAMVIDGEGQTWDIGTWKGMSDVKTRVKRLWDFFENEARNQAVEYRFAICCPVTTALDEIQAWRDMAKRKKTPFSLVLPSEKAQPSARMTVRPSGVIPPAMFADPSTRIIDETITARHARMTRLLRLSVPRTQEGRGTEEIYPLSTFLLSIATPDTTYTTRSYHVILHNPAPGHEDEDIGTLLVEDLHRLVVLGRMRFGFEGDEAVHVAGVETALDCCRKVVTV